MPIPYEGEKWTVIQHMRARSDILWTVLSHNNATQLSLSQRLILLAVSDELLGLAAAGETPARRRGALLEGTNLPLPETQLLIGDLIALGVLAEDPETTFVTSKVTDFLVQRWRDSGGPKGRIET